MVAIPAPPAYRVPVPGRTAGIQPDRKCPAGCRRRWLTNRPVFCKILVKRVRFWFLGDSDAFSEVPLCFALPLASAKG